MPAGAIANLVAEAVTVRRELRVSRGLWYNVAVMNERIEINPNVCHGSPVIRGTRVLVSQILGALSGGDSIETVLEDYPSITSEDISAVFDFAGSLARFEDTPYNFAMA